MTDKLLTMEDAAERLGTSVRFVRRLIAERRIAYVKLGRHVRIAERDLINFVTTGRVEAGGRLGPDEPPPVRERAPAAVWSLAGALPDERRPPARGPGDVRHQDGCDPASGPGRGRPEPWPV
jgi:excisionase family DNA binding protein